MDKGLTLSQIEGLFETAGAVHRHRQARLGHVLRDRATSTRSSRSTARSTCEIVCGGTLLEAAEAIGRLDAYRSWLTRERLRLRRGLGRHDRHAARAQARDHRAARPRLPRALRGRLEGRRGGLRALPVGRVDQGGARRRRLEGDHRGARVGHGGHLPRHGRGALRPDRRDRPRHRQHRGPALRGAAEVAAGLVHPPLGRDVNLGNIPPEEVISLETLRLGLRTDTLREVLLAPAEPAR